MWYCPDAKKCNACKKSACSSNTLPQLKLLLSKRQAPWLLYHHTVLMQKNPLQKSAAKIRTQQPYTAAICYTPMRSPAEQTQHNQSCITPHHCNTTPAEPKRGPCRADTTQPLLHHTCNTTPDHAAQGVSQTAHTRQLVTEHTFTHQPHSFSFSCVAVEPMIRTRMQGSVSQRWSASKPHICMCPGPPTRSKRCTLSSAKI
ncbi:hypothetical protein COO60DRAFT_164749 [Scenedesmus sp. NREL 46B-D3]|nr:hypothetical protein COO60DRAFT_164749 [Scenedesmus sp. NREL 46B-D3]